MHSKNTLLCVVLCVCVYPVLICVPATSYSEEPVKIKMSGSGKDASQEFQPLDEEVIRERMKQSPGYAESMRQHELYKEILELSKEYRGSGQSASLKKKMMTAIKELVEIEAKERDSQIEVHTKLLNNLKEESELYRSNKNELIQKKFNQFTGEAPSVIKKLKEKILK